MAIDAVIFNEVADMELTSVSEMVVFEPDSMTDCLAVRVLTHMRH